MTRFRTLALAQAIALVASCTSSRAPVDTTAVQRSLDSALAVHGQLFIAKDVDKLLESYTPDAVIFASNMEPVRGHAAIKPFLTAFVQGVTFTSLAYRTLELAVYGDSAWHVVGYEGTMAGTPAPTSDHGSAFALWVRDAGGTWRIHRDIFSSSVPLAAAAK